MIQSPRSKTTALLLCLFLGSLGAHRFYAGHIILGVLMIFTLGGFGLWALVDFILICANKLNDNDGLPISRPLNWPVFLIGLIIHSLLNLIIFSR
ncbi:MAG: TM2 domain-containing protein [Deltaproteobacteria bacterium]|nr:TM2 domain-containing protein [Deltaproteobacteria bacterium]